MMHFFPDLQAMSCQPATEDEDEDASYNPSSVYKWHPDDCYGVDEDEISFDDFVHRHHLQNRRKTAKNSHRESEKETRTNLNV